MARKVGADDPRLGLEERRPPRRENGAERMRFRRVEGAVLDAARVERRRRGQPRCRGRARRARRGRAAPAPTPPRARASRAIASPASRTQCASGYASRTMRVRPWLEPRAWSSSNCSSTVTSAPRSVSAHAAAQPITPAPTTATTGVSGVLLRHATRGKNRVRRSHGISEQPELRQARARRRHPHEPAPAARRPLRSRRPGGGGCSAPPTRRAHPSRRRRGDSIRRDHDRAERDREVVRLRARQGRARRQSFMSV